ncbi:hypothetical protein ACIO8G_14055 [Streptomyces sp. NPDC087219]|uniref:hypothetical protein n=1 Tax=unclassified Streptomyces TaxID=2593676 RepID=UPI0037F4D7A5
MLGEDDRVACAREQLADFLPRAPPDDDGDDLVASAPQTGAGGARSPQPGARSPEPGARTCDDPGR